MTGHDEKRSSVALELERHMAPESCEEQALLEDIQALTFYQVARTPDADMANGHMQPQQCHNNAAAWAARDPSGNSRVVAGWWRRDDLFLFHSVVLSHSRLCCVTPDDHPSPLDFAPDPLIEWQEVNGRKVARRLGKAVPYVVRTHPQHTIRAAAKARQAMGDADRPQLQEPTPRPRDE